MKKWKNDRSISFLKKMDLLYLWTEWKHCPNEPPQYENDLIKSVNEAPVSHSTNTDNETTMLNEDNHRTISI